MSIRVWAYLEEYEQEQDAILAAVRQVLASGSLILGEQVRRFEEEFSAYCGVGHGVGVANGTDALFLALKALGIGAGDEVITVSNTAVPTVSAIVSAGATPRFVDIDPHTYLMDTSKIEAAITERTRCILPVHLYGQCVDMTELGRIAKRHELKVVEDCAQSHGASQNGRKAGALSDAAAFSFYPTKILGGFGDAGMVVTDVAETAEALRRLRFYGMEEAYFAKEHGYNSRLDELHAAILLCKLPHLDGYIARRRSLAARYDARLAEAGLTLPVTGEGNQHAYYLYVCRHPRRDELIAELAKREIFVNVSYRWPVHTMPPYRHGVSDAEALPVTVKAASEIFSLPMYPSLDEAAQERVIEAVLDITATLA